MSSRHRGADAALGHPVEQPLPQLLDAFGRPLGAHRLAQPVGLVRPEPGAVDGQLHHLLLEQRHAQRLAERRAHRLVRHGRVLQAVVTAQVRVHRTALDRARPDQRDLDDQVVELPRAQPRQGGHLRPGLHLEHAHRVRLAQHLVDGRVLLRDGGHRPVLTVVLGHQVEAVVQRGQHAQAEQVDLDQARVGAVVLVPLQHGAARHPGPLHRAHLPHRAVADHHAARMDAQVPRQPLHPGRQLRHRGRDPGRERLPVRGRSRADLPRPGVGVRRREPERAARVPQRHPRPVRDHVGDLGGPVPAVGAVDVLDDLLAAAVLDVQVDVRRAVPALGKEPLEQQVVRDRVDAGDAEREADRRVRRRPAALAQDVVVLAERHDVVHDQEVAGEPEALDHVELPGDLGVRARHPFGPRSPVAGRGLAGGQLAQPGGFGVPVRDREVGQPGGDHREVERAGPAQLDGALEDARIAAQQRGHLRA